MITVDQRGRLGNAMFQWAFGLAASRALGTSFWVDEQHLRPVFRLDPTAASTLRRLRALQARRTGRLSTREVDNLEAPAAVLGALTDDTAYGGYFQSADYLAGHEQAIRTAFTLRRRHRRAFAEAHGDLRGHIAVHVRRGDYAGFNGGALLPESWYRACLTQLSSPGARPVVFVSDDLEHTRSTYADVPGARFVAASEAVDLQVLMRADALVLSPSSFSWWGAWLNPRTSRVLVPERWLNFRAGGPEYPAGVIDGSWTRIAVEGS
jgi:hypothetical protein